MLDIALHNTVAAMQFDRLGGRAVVLFVLTINISQN